VQDNLVDDGLKVPGAQSSVTTVEAERDLRSTEDSLHAALAGGIVSHVLVPGMRLKEQTIAETFGVSRTVLRPVLRRLAHEGLVVILPHRGAHVALPAVDEARQVLAARRVIEGGLLEQYKGPLDEAFLSRLRAQITAEDAARASGDDNTLYRTSAEFHLILAEMTGNDLLLRVLRDLIARSVVITAIYQPSAEAGCRTDHHRILLSLLESGSWQAAARFMIHHMTTTENDLDFNRAVHIRVDLKTALSQLKPVFMRSTQDRAFLPRAERDEDRPGDAALTMSED
jgi:DNA-binding GntR family transcriptional regulator